MSKVTDTREVIITSDNTGEHWNVAVWDPRTGSTLSMYKNAGALAHHTVQLLGDSYLLGADLTKPRIHIWPLNSPSPVSNLRLTTPGKVTSLSCSPSGGYIVAAVSEKLFLWQVCNGRLLASLSQHYQSVTCLAFNKDGSLFASGGEDGLVFIWSLYSVANDERSAPPLHSFSHHSLPVKDLQFGHGGAQGRFCTISLDRTCNIYNPCSGTLLVSLVFDAPLASVCMNTRESDLFVGCTDGYIYRFNLHKPPRGMEHHVQVKKNDERSSVFRVDDSSIVALSVSIDCRYLLSGSTSGEVHLWDIVSRQVLRTIDHKGPITSAFFAKYYENFRVTDLKPSLRIAHLQRVADDVGREGSIEVISRDRNPDDILRNLYEESRGPVTCDSSEDIAKLKRINHEMYQKMIEYCLQYGQQK